MGNLRRVCRRGTSCQGWPINLCIFCSSSAGIYFVLIALLLDSLSLNDFHRSGFRSENLIFHISRWNVFPGWRVSSETDAGPVSSLCTVFFYCKKLWLISARGGAVLCVCVCGRGVPLFSRISDGNILCTFNLLIWIKDYYDETFWVFLPVRLHLSPSSGREKTYIKPEWCL